MPQCGRAREFLGGALIARSILASWRSPSTMAPNPAWTPQLLDVLASYDVRATFFMLGKYVQAEPALVRRVAEAGHLIGNHSWSHPNLAITAPGRVPQELVRAKEMLEQTTGVQVKYFRPPFGGRRPDVLRVARSLGMCPVLWNAMASDWSDRSANRIAKRMMHSIDRLELRGRAANILLHDRRASWHGRGSWTFGSRYRPVAISLQSYPSFSDRGCVELEPQMD